MRAELTKKAGLWVLIVGFLLTSNHFSTGYAETPPLTEEETEWLTYMREEEKLARDVYLYLYETWRVRIFSNLSKSEQEHMDAIKVLLDRYGVQDPVGDDTVGVFSNPDLKNLYEELISQGEQSLNAAFEVGITIETKDIEDLTEAIASASHKDIKKVYSHIRQASIKHLEALESHRTLPSSVRWRHRQIQ